MTEAIAILTPDPDPDPSTGRGDRGRFIVGNRLGRGRPTTGASIIEWMNILGDLTLTAWLAVKNDETAPGSKRIAASILIRTLEGGDLADYESYLSGEKTLADLRKTGLLTSGVKKAKTRTRTDSNGVVTVEREVELHNRDAVAFDQVMDRTEGRPHATINFGGDAPDILVTQTVNILAADPLIVEAARRLCEERAQQNEALSAYSEPIAADAGGGE